MKKRIGGVILSRMDSSRLPGKAMKTLGDKSLVQWPIDALKSLDQDIAIILATSSRHIDSELEVVAQDKGISFYQGSLKNVSGRLVAAAQSQELDYVFRMNGDSPFISTELIKEAIETINEVDVDFVSNLYHRSYPYGVSCELLKVSTFTKLNTNFNTYEKEHCTSFYYKNSEHIKYSELTTLDNNYSHLRWTIDTPSDLERLNEYLKKTELKDINQQPIINVIKDYNSIMS